VDRCLIFIVEGIFKGFKGMEGKTYLQGSVLGVEVFLTGKAWDEDIMCDSRTGAVAKFNFDSLLDFKNSAPITAARLYRCLVRHLCQYYVKTKRIDDSHTFEMLHVEDEDLYLDIKLDHKKGEPSLLNQFSLAQSNTTKAQSVDKRSTQTKGLEFDSVGLFLTDEFKEILKEE